MKIKQWSPRCLIFQCRSIPYSTIICNFTSERKLNVVRSQGFLFDILLWGNTLLKRGCRFNHVSRLFADKIIIVVTIYVYVMYASGLKLIWTQVELSRKGHLMGRGKLLISKGVDFSKFSLAGMKKCGAHSYSVSYIHQTSFWRAQNIVDRNFCAAIILWENPLERILVQVPISTQLCLGIQLHH